MRGTKHTYIKEWRKHRGLSQERLAARIGATHGTLSKIETGKQPYQQWQLEALAEALQTDPASLLMRNPLDPDPIWTVWDSIPPADRGRAIEVLKAFARTGTQG